MQNPLYFWQGLWLWLQSPMPGLGIALALLGEAGALSQHQTQGQKWWRRQHLGIKSYDSSPVRPALLHGLGSRLWNLVSSPVLQLSQRHPCNKHSFCQRHLLLLETKNIG